ncbi:Cel74a [Plectosphaerella plurivora]|uniref:Cel74a n=1 Tax=Plectosphaerella plurivora TaxID=936078 RepID=A0A9P8V5K8_9PEZI|nr:Cel74a [Plectosphaerella plurivora]
MKALTLLAAAAAPVFAAWDFKNVKFGGGGGFVPGISFHPTTPGVAYARTDIGGLYRLNADDSWTPVTDFVASHDKWGRWGIDTMGLDPSNPDRVYAAFGMYTNDWDPNNGAIGRSNDKGNTWTFTDLPFKVGGNMPGRGMGERLAVDPKNPNVIYFGARSGNGLWRSTNGGSTFSKVTSFTNVGTFIPDPNDVGGYNGDRQGLAFVTFDSTSPLLNGATSRIFVGTADNVTASVYVTENAGQTWAPVAGQPGKFFPHKARLSPTENALYLTYADGSGPYDGTDGAVYRYDIAAGTWKNITPPGDKYFGFGGLGLDAKKPGTLIVATLNSWWPDAQIYRSTDSGTTWSTLWSWAAYPEMNMYYGISAPKAPWIYKNFISTDTKKLGWMIEALEIDPHDSNHWLYGTGLTIYGGRDLTRWDTVHNVTIQSLADGIEETAVLDLASAPGGSEVLAAVGDVSGFTFANKNLLGTAPASAWDTPMFTSSTGVDYAGNKPASVVRIGNGNGSPQVALSNSGGSTWFLNYAASNTQSGGKVAYSADGDTILWSSANSGVLRSLNQANFAAVAGVPSGAKIASDKRTNANFYAGSGSSFLRSTNAAASFSAGGALAGATAIRDITAHPARAGEVYVSTDVGIFFSSDAGVSFTKLSSSLTDTQAVAVGRGAGTSWNLYAWGTGSAGHKLYGSADNGATWTDIQGTRTFGAVDANPLAGSGNSPGVVYVGTNGRGVFWAEGALSGTPPSSSTSSAAVPTSTRPATTSSAAVTTSSAAQVTTTSRPPSTTSVPPVSTTSSAPPSTGTNVAQRFGQCGGQGWTGPTVCVAPYTCQKQNDWYSQCL